MRLSRHAKTTTTTKRCTQGNSRVALLWNISGRHGWCTCWRSRPEAAGRLRSWAKHERLSIAMALAEKLHHSAQPVMEQHVVPRELKTASAREGEEYKKNALYEALRGQKTPLPGVRTVSTAPVPQVALPDLGGDMVDDTLVTFLVRQTLLEREEEKRKEEEKAKEQEEEVCLLLSVPSERRTAEQRSRLMALLQLRSAAALAPKSKMRRKRKKKLPKTRSFSGSSVLARPFLRTRHVRADPDYVVNVSVWMTMTSFFQSCLLFFRASCFGGPPSFFLSGFIMDAGDVLIPFILVKAMRIQRFLPLNVSRELRCRSCACALHGESASRCLQKLREVRRPKLEFFTVLLGPRRTFFDLCQWCCRCRSP